MNPEVAWLPVERDGHRWQVLCVSPPDPRRVLVWLPALGVPARHYEAFARALAALGVAVLVHEWRGFGASSLRASHGCDWGYRELLQSDIPTSCEAALTRFPGASLVLGGHSLGGQLAACSLALDPRRAEALWLVASGSPYSRTFPWRHRLWLPAAYRLLAWLARAFGALPGRRIGFGGREARGVIRDWSRTALTGRYAAPGVGDMEERLRQVQAPVRAVLLSHDWLAPRGSLDFLLSKLAPSEQAVRMLDADTLGARPDHFAWMHSPDAVARALAD